MAVEVAAGLLFTFSFEFALGFAAAMQQSIGVSFSFTKLPLGPLRALRRLTTSPIPALDKLIRGDAGPACLASVPNTPIAWRRMRL